MRQVHSNFFSRLLTTAVAVAALSAATAAPAQYRADHIPQAPPMTNLPNPTITPRPNAQVNEDLTFTDSTGKKVRLGDLFHHKTAGGSSEKPVVLSLVYFSCPMLCGLNQEALANAIQQGPFSLRLGQDYDVVVVSIDPDDTTEMAATKRKNYLARAEKPESQAGFTYLTGTAENIRQLADTVGFGFFRNDPDSGKDKFAHSLGIFVLTPGAHVSETIVNADYTPAELHAALLAAADNKIGTGFLERVALPCGAMRLNPKTGMYEHNPWFYAGTAGGLASIAFTAIFLAVMWKGEAKRRKAAGADPPDPPAPPGGPTPAVSP
jgi:protein SCO1/2